MDATKPRSMAEADLRTERELAEAPDVTALVERAKQGDADAFGSLMLLYERRIVSLGLQMGLTRDDSLDACQDAFIKVFRYIHRFRSGESFFKWLYRIAVNVIYDHLRRAKASETVSFEDMEHDQPEQIEDKGTPLARRIEEADLASRLMSELSCLTGRERIVLVLRDLQEMSGPEVGKVLGLSQVTVRRHCMTARQKLRDRLFPRRD